MARSNEDLGHTPPRRRGRLWVISAPSGAGKTTLVHALMRRRPNMRFSVSYTTRPRRCGEQDGEDYFFVDEQRFAGMVAEQAFLEHAEVFGHHYGTARGQVEGLLARGFDVLLEIDWQGARQVRSRMPECRGIFILPPSLDELARRLRGRGTDDETVIRRRLEQAREDMGHWAEFDFAVVNDDLDTALEALLEIVQGTGDRAATGNPELAARISGILLGGQ